MKNDFMKCLLTVFAAILAFTASTQPGTLDNSFGENGKIYDKNFNARADVIIAQKDNKIIAAGSYEVDENGVGIHIIRYNNDGNTDTGFADKGRFVISWADGGRLGYTENILIQNDGKILVGIKQVVNAEDFDIVLMRLNEDGTLDNSFNDDGIVRLAIGPYQDDLGEIALQQDGKILVAGLKDPTGFGYYDNKIPFLLRLNGDGSYDNSFGENGIAIQHFNDIYVQIRSLIVLPDGKIIMGGDDDGYNDRQVVLFKYNYNGSLDNEFGDNGMMESSFPKDQYGRNTVGSIYDLLLLPNGKIFATGSTSYSNFFIAQFTSSGNTDANFSEGKGYSIFPAFPQYSKGLQSYILKGSKILVTGSFGSGAFAAYRFLSDGALDSSFGANGVAYNYFTVASSIGRRGSAVQQDGKIILAGRGSPERDDYYHICMLRLHGDGGLTQEGYVKIRRWMKKNGISWWPGISTKKITVYTIERSNDNLHFTPVAYVNKPQSNNTDEYHFEDPSPAKGNNYYRLAYTNEESKIIHSNVIAVEEEKLVVAFFPNPVTNNLHIQGLTGKTRLSITDINGRVKMSTVANTASLHWNVAMLNKGYYILRIENKEKEMQFKKFYKE